MFWPVVQRSLSIQPSVRLTLTLSDRKNRPFEGVSLCWIVGGVIFITFTKARRGGVVVLREEEGGGLRGRELFPAVDTGLDHFFFLSEKQ